MAKKILTANQLKILTAIGEEPFLTENFYLSGGTALAGSTWDELIITRRRRELIVDSCQSLDRTEAS